MIHINPSPVFFTLRNESLSPKIPNQLDLTMGALVIYNGCLSYLQHLSVIDLLAIENSRMVPQQATTTITNVADIESFIQAFEQRTGKEFLQVIDIPWSERVNVVRELKLMGLTAGSLFPGLDGTCEELKEKMFD